MPVGIGNIPGAVITNAATPVAFTGAADPNTGAGFAADVGSIYYATTSASHWLKIDTGDTDWSPSQTLTGVSWRDRHVAKAMSLLGTIDVDVYYDPLTETSTARSYSTYAGAGGTGTATHSVGQTGHPSVHFSQVTGDNGVLAYITGGLARGTSTDEWYYAARVKHPQAALTEGYWGVGVMSNAVGYQIAHIGTNFSVHASQVHLIFYNSSYGVISSVDTGKTMSDLSSFVDVSMYQLGAGQKQYGSVDGSAYVTYPAAAQALGAGYLSERHNLANGALGSTVGLYVDDIVIVTPKA
jgi:hypothetical protein